MVRKIRRGTPRLPGTPVGGISPLVAAAALALAGAFAYPSMAGGIGGTPQAAAQIACPE